MKKTRVSVIAPVYKTEQYIDQCVRSLIGQSYPDIEIILVDDGSPDNCGRICDEYAKQDSRIRVIHKENGGLSDARNVGIEMATGENLTFVDSDDYILPDMIEFLMDIIANENADIAQCDYVRSKSDCISELQHDLSQNDKFTVYSESKMSAYLKENAIYTATWGKIYNKSLFNEIRFPFGRLHEDVFTTYRLIHEAGSVAVSDYIGYIYRINNNSITASKFTSKKLDSVYGELERAEFIEENYQELRKNAYSGIIQACNQCLLQMSKNGFAGEKEDAFLQKMYRQYGKFYICDKVSFLGKIVVALAMVNEHLAKSALSLIR